jgi:1,4-alpha-glucan branching enzyme
MARVHFKLVAPGAKQVLLAGDFTEWAMHPKKMKRTKPRGRTFETDVSLSPGCHEYKFIVDGDWIEDPKAATQPNCYGTVNSVCEVS